MQPEWFPSPAKTLYVLQYKFAMVVRYWSLSFNIINLAVEKPLLRVI
jgi:hypothetical protein